MFPLNPVLIPKSNNNYSLLRDFTKNRAEIQYPEISQLLSSIAASKEVVDSFPLPPEIEQNIRRASTLKSSLYSAKIEGNPLSLEELQINPSKDQKKVEVFNILKAVNWIHERSNRDVSLKDILELHKMVMAGLVEESDQGKFRTNLEAIFNSARIPVYLPPRPSQILAFMKGLLPLEEFLDNHRTLYYRSLESSEKDTTDYLEFMLEAIAQTAEETKNLVLEKKQADIEELLLPRRAEILNIIKDHQIVNFDVIRRRFMAINERTLRYDLKKLQDQGLIRKRGNTKGVWYEAS